MEREIGRCPLSWMCVVWQVWESCMGVSMGAGGVLGKQGCHVIPLCVVHLIGEALPHSSLPSFSGLFLLSFSIDSLS